MEQKLARVLDSTGEPIQWLYVRIRNATCPPLLCVHGLAAHPPPYTVGQEFDLSAGNQKVGDIEKKNINELDWDGARVRGMTFTSGRTNARAYSSRATSAYCRTLKAFSAQWRCQK